MDLVLVVLITALSVPLALFADGSARSALGFLFILVCPGYALVAALFPKKGSIDWLERATLSVVLSLCTVSLMGLILNYTSWGIQPTPVLISASVFVTALTALAFLRRLTLPKTDRFDPRPRLSLSLLTTQPRQGRAINLVLALSILGTIGLLTYGLLRPKVGERFTEFYMLGAQSKAGDYSRQLVLGESAQITLGIVNQEQKPIDYHIEIRVDADTVREIESIRLASGESREFTVAFEPRKAGVNQKVEFSLLKDGSEQPYRNLEMWLDVMEPE